MDVRYFLGERLAFIKQLYPQSAAPFIETKRKIEAEEEPFIPPYSEDPEPPFLAEWIEAEESLQVLGHVSISMLSASLNLYLKAWERKLGRPVDSSFKSDFKKGWLNGYMAYFKNHFSVNFENCPCDLVLLEELILVRNRVQHPETITMQRSYYSQSDLSKIKSPYFIEANDQELLSGMEDGEKSWLMPPSIHVTEEKLMKAIAEVEDFAKWLEETDH